MGSIAVRAALAALVAAAFPGAALAAPCETGGASP